jgi:Family of unknown function (DUF6152)
VDTFFRRRDFACTKGAPRSARCDTIEAIRRVGSPSNLRHVDVMSETKSHRLYKSLHVFVEGRVVMNLRLFTGAALVFGLTGGIAVAHHGWGSYDASKIMTVDAAVASLEWQNPHVHLGVNHDGAVWELVLAPPFRMHARGLSPEMIKVGTRVSVEGYPSTRVEHEMRAERIRVDGQTFELR